MGHYAYLDENNVVVTVITGRDEDDVPSDVEGWESWEKYYETRSPVDGTVRCLRTSYNTYGNSHSGGGTPFRGNCAGAGYTYDENNDVFIPPAPYASWVLNESTWLWDPPVPYPDDGQRYVWDEASQSWALA